MNAMTLAVTHASNGARLCTLDGRELPLRAVTLAAEAGGGAGAGREVTVPAYPPARTAPPVRARLGTPRADSLEP